MIRILSIDFRSIYEPQNSCKDDMFISITEAPIEARELIERTRNENAGAIVTFQGTVRRFSGEIEVESLVYDSYREMAEKTIREICENALEKFEVLDINVIHRIGKVALTEDSIVICVASAHRKDAFLACEFVIDTIKKEVPIWKMDVSTQGKKQWRD